jgi:glutamate synthase domain-containing protein 2
MSANHIERDIEFTLQAGADDIILDGRGGGTGAAPLLFRDHISVPTLPALVWARHYLDKKGASGRVTPIIRKAFAEPGMDLRMWKVDPLFGQHNLMPGN